MRVKAPKHRLLNGASIDLGKLSRPHLAFLFDLQRRAMNDEDYFELERAVCGPGAYPLQGSKRVTARLHATPLFLVAEDIAYRAGIRQGVIAPGDEDELVITEQLVSVAEAAEQLGITRSAVIKAVQLGRLRGRKVGKTWILLKRSVQGYEVAAHRVAAGRAARRQGARASTSQRRTTLSVR